MRFKVSYYDMETDKVLIKNCEQMEFSNETFSFYPVDKPIKSYKPVIVSHPKIHVYQTGNRIKISVKGYQCMASGGYWPTETIIESIEED